MSLKTEGAVRFSDVIFKDNSGDEHVAILVSIQDSIKSEADDFMFTNFVCAARSYFEGVKAAWEDFEKTEAKAFKNAEEYGVQLDNAPRFKASSNPPDTQRSKSKKRKADDEEVQHVPIGPPPIPEDRSKRLRHEGNTRESTIQSNNGLNEPERVVATTTTGHATLEDRYNIYSNLLPVESDTTNNLCRFLDDSWTFKNQRDIHPSFVFFYQRLTTMNAENLRFLLQNHVLLTKQANETTIKVYARKFAALLDLPDSERSQLDVSRLDRGIFCKNFARVLNLCGCPRVYRIFSKIVNPE